MTNTAVDVRPQRQYLEVLDPIPMLDTARFEHMQRIAQVMANSSLIPEALHSIAEGTGTNRKLTPLPPQVVLANCFLIVNQSVRWGMDPFAVAQCCSVVHGRLMYEGKLVAAVIEAKAGVQLEYTFGIWDPTTELVDLTKEGTNDSLGIIVSATLLIDGTGRPVEIHGGVGAWKTSGSNSPWRPGNFRRQLRYRGAREWARAYTPALMLGVYTDDEMSELQESRRADRATDVGRSTIASRLPGAAAKSENGFNGDHVHRTVGGGETVTEDGEIVEDEKVISGGSTPEELEKSLGLKEGTFAEMEKEQAGNDRSGAGEQQQQSQSVSQKQDVKTETAGAGDQHRAGVGEGPKTSSEGPKTSSEGHKAPSEGKNASPTPSQETEAAAKSAADNRETTDGAPAAASSPEPQGGLDLAGGSGQIKLEELVRRFADKLYEADTPNEIAAMSSMFWKDHPKSRPPSAAIASVNKIVDAHQARVNRRNQPREITEAAIIEALREIPK